MVGDSRPSQARNSSQNRLVCCAQHTSRYVGPGFMLRNRVGAASCAMIGILDAT
jgi:hypothetical protein